MKSTKTIKSWSFYLLLTVILSATSCGKGETEDITPSNPDSSNTRKNPNVSLSKEAAPSSFSTKILLEDYTATWCGYCPRVGHAIEEAMKKNNNIIGIGIHNDKEMGFSKVESLMKKFNIGGFPTAMLNRSTIWSESYTPLQEKLSQTSSTGIAIQSSLTGDQVKGKLKIGFNSNLSKSINYAILLVEDKVVAAQKNYYNEDKDSPFYQKGEVIENFQHVNVLRKSATDIFGDIVPEEYTKKGKVCQADFEFKLDGYKSENCYIIAFVVEKDGNNVLNVQMAKVGSNKDFD